MKPLRGSVLLIGYGNPGRLDDGLGPAAAEWVEAAGWERVTVESCYQLAIEHAEQAAAYDVVIFADADVACSVPFLLEPIDPKMDAAFSTHRVEPAAILGLAHNVFAATTEGYLLRIRGHEFDDFGERLSPQAADNLAAAMRFLESALQPKGCEVG